MAAKHTTEIPPEALDVLRRSTLDDARRLLKLPPEQLQRPLYDAVAKVINNAGGVWSRKQSGFLFAEDPTEKLQLATETGKTTDEKKLFQAYYTPADLAKHLVELADLKDGQFILEPSCGEGAILKAILDSGVDFAGLSAVELNPKAIAAARELLAATWDEDHALYEGDFLEQKFHPGDFDRVIMTPPFTGNQDLDHVERALTLLAPKGVLVAVMPASPDRRRFQNILRKYDCSLEQLPAGTFSESGSEVRTLILVARK